MDSPVISRLAPTPSGYLHLGNAFNFLLTALLVDFQDGHLHLRIDDLDEPRVMQSSVEDIFIQLEWLGIDYDFGPSGPDEFSQNFHNDYAWSCTMNHLNSFANPDTFLPVNAPVQKSDKYLQTVTIRELAATKNLIY